MARVEGFKNPQQSLLRTVVNYALRKLMTFGPVRDVISYLIRRAEKNTSVSGQTSRELTLFKMERKRRKEK